MSMTEEVDGVRLGLPDSTVYALFSEKRRPHDDELTFFEVRLVGPGLHARTAVESISGDHGMRGEFSDRGDGVLVEQDARLVDWLRELAGSRDAWDGEERWRSLADELRLAATCDSLGHVALVVSIQPRPWEPTWRAEVTLRYSLGDLTSAADQLDAWFVD